MEINNSEVERLSALYSYGVLDTGFEERFDRIVRVASLILSTPIALISLVDKDRQWFKASIGLDVQETARDISFCTHAIKGTEVFVVPDATQDKRFANNPLVAGKPDIRFYAGAPLIGSKGHAVGTLCVIDHEPHQEFNDKAQQLLRDLADTVVDLLELRRMLNRYNVLRRELKPMAAQLTQLAE